MFARCLHDLHHFTFSLIYSYPCVCFYNFFFLFLICLDPFQFYDRSEKRSLFLNTTTNLKYCDHLWSWRLLFQLKHPNNLFLSFIVCVRVYNCDLYECVPWMLCNDGCECGKQNKNEQKIKHNIILWNQLKVENWTYGACAKLKETKKYSSNVCTNGNIRPRLLILFAHKTECIFITWFRRISLHFLLIFWCCVSHLPWIYRTSSLS